MTLDLVSVGPVALDMTFVGLEAMPRPGEERFARDFLLTPGGAANVAIGAARLGLRSALACPVSTDLAGRYLAAMLEEDGVRWVGPRSERTPVTAIFPADGDRAMATFDPGGQTSAEQLAELAPRSVVIGAHRLADAPPGARVYATVGDLESRLGPDLLRPALGRAAAFLANEVEALRISGAGTVEDAAATIASHVEVAIVTLGARGVVAATDGQLVTVAAPAVDAHDTTGAGDLFASAYAWADLAGAALRDRLAWAAVYAALSVRTPTARGGAVALAELERAGREAGLAPLPHTSGRESR